nr:hypothetical protein [Tanacetum cinerariifolium]
MTSFGYRLNPHYAIKECLSCGTLYTEDFCCSKGNVEDKILVPKLPKNYARGPHETFHCQPPQYTVDYPIFNAHDDLLNSQNELSIAQNKLMEQMITLTSMCEMVAEIVISEEEEIEDDNLREKLLNVHLLIANIEALKDNPTPSFEFSTKSSSTSPKSFLEETNTFHNSLPEFKNFYFDLKEISSGSTTTHSDISLLDYEVFYFYDDHIEEISSGSTITHSNIYLSEYDWFIFDLSKDQFPPTDRSDLLMRSSSMDSLTSYLHRSMIVFTLGIFQIRVS